jgi:hypothetical protein
VTTAAPEITAPPERSLRQRRAALVRANEIRTYRKNLKLDLVAGRRAVADLILDPDDKLATMAVLDLLLATPKVGRVKVQKALLTARVSPSKTVGGLTQRQRTDLVIALGRYGRPPGGAA